MYFRRNGYLWILLALVMLLIDLREDSVDILPDSLAFLLIALGLHFLRQQDRAYGKLIPLAVFLAALAVVNLRIDSQWMARYGDVSYYYNPLAYVDWIALVLTALLVWLICRIGRRMARARIMPALEVTIGERVQLFIAIVPLVIGAEAFYHAMPQSRFYIAPIATFCEIIAWLLLMDIFWQMSRHLKPLSPEPST